MRSPRNLSQAADKQTENWNEKYLQRKSLTRAAGVMRSLCIGIGLQFGETQTQHVTGCEQLMEQRHRALATYLGNQTDEPRIRARGGHRELGLAMGMPLGPDGLSVGNALGFTMGPALGPKDRKELSQAVGLLLGTKFGSLLVGRHKCGRRQWW